jgi:hypothetical protein
LFPFLDVFANSDDLPGHVGAWNEISREIFAEYSMNLGWHK